MRLLKAQTREPSVNQIIRIGMDTSKHIFQLHGVDAAEQPVLRKRLRRRQVLAFFAKLPPTVIGMEACGAAHYWGRELRKLGHEVKLMAPQHVKAYVKRNKNDGRDAEGTCEAMGRPTMQFVPVKTEEQQAALMLAGVRQQLIARRTQLSNAIRGYAAEFGVTAAKTRLGKSTRAGDEVWRSLLVAGATAVIQQVRRGRGHPSPWLVALLKRKPPKLAAVALANKIARIAWRLMTTGESYDGARMLGASALAA